MSVQGIVDDRQTKIITVTATPSPPPPTALSDTVLVVGSIGAVALGTILAAYEMAKEKR